jgi:hypothetical protein
MEIFNEKEKETTTGFYDSYKLSYTPSLPGSFFKYFLMGKELHLI